ncbi:hypothetical protein PK35_05085 [Tamlana nanhaiensis]|uniref:Nucleotide-diphospho-sugar transferase domain-containing protein n=1 Tax=Neotamlana nanhaiensis TaxID=1382798 RepID=A0A0D7W4Q9_9FLAO|nr:glycosyltransferase [Tamlana nanhaiensis]KJD34106.1 hypothetical protein PK35_05085 [Tamlana nanhaiensis]
MITQGVIYIANGDKFINEAIASAKSLKQHNSNLSVTLFSNKKVGTEYFDKQILIENPGYRDKVYYLEKSPYERTLFLDTDTFVCDNIDELFFLLNHFDIALAHAPMRLAQDYKPILSHLNQQKITRAYPEFNTGVILYKNGAHFKAMMKHCQELYNSYSENGKLKLPDQIVFREAIYYSKLKLATLTPEYNCRSLFYTYVEGTVKILHDRRKNMYKWAKKVNKSKFPRIIIPGIGCITQKSIWFKLISKL